MYWHISLTLDGSRNRLTPKFKYETNTFNGEAYVRTLNWSGGPSVGVSGPGIRSTGELTDLDRHGSMLLADLPYEVLRELEAKVSDVIQSTRSGLALVNTAILLKMPTE
jgi:hypothetical protein